MEVKQKKLRDYVVSFENVIPKKTHNIFKKIFTDDKILNQYEPAKIVRSLNEHVIDRDTRPVDVFDLWNSKESVNLAELEKKVNILFEEINKLSDESKTFSRLKNANCILKRILIKKAI